MSESARARRPRRDRLDRARTTARRAGRRLPRRTASARQTWRGTPGVGLPVHLLQPAAPPAASVAPRLRRGPGGRPARRFLGRAGYADGGDGVAVTRDYLLSAAGDGRVHRRPAARDRRPAGPAELLRPARVGDGLSHAPRCARRRCRCGWALPAPTRWSRRCPCGAATSTPSGSSPSRPHRATPRR